MSRYFVNEAAKPQKKTFAEILCRIARLRELTLLYAAASFAVALLLFLLSQKKSTDSKPCGLPSVALAKDGGRWGTRTLDLCRVKAAL